MTIMTSLAVHDLCMKKVLAKIILSVFTAEMGLQL
jgi:hypothetical protein